MVSSRDQKQRRETNVNQIDELIQWTLFLEAIMIMENYLQTKVYLIA